MAVKGNVSRWEPAMVGHAGCKVGPPRIIRMSSWQSAMTAGLAEVSAPDRIAQLEDVEDALLARKGDLR